MTLLDIDTLFRASFDESDPTQGLSAADAATFYTAAQFSLALEIYWPQATLFFSTSASGVEYTLPEMVQILRVYLNGQELAPTTIPILEGDSIELYDQSGSAQQPAWMDQAVSNPPQTYPYITGDRGYPNAGGLPFQAGMRPKYYLRGANMGFVPAPNAVYTNGVQVDYIPIPPPLVNPQDVSIYPILAREALVQKAGQKYYLRDGNMNLAAQCLTAYNNELVKVRFWVDNLLKALPKRAAFIPYRTFYNLGPLLKAGSGEF